MTGVQGIEKNAGFSPANLPHNDPVRPVPKGGLEQVGEADLTLVNKRACLDGWKRSIPKTSLLP